MHREYVMSCIVITDETRTLWLTVFSSQFERQNRHLHSYAGRALVMMGKWCSGGLLLSPAVCPAREGYNEDLGSDGEGIWSIDSVLAFGGRFLVRIVCAMLKNAVSGWLFLPDTEFEATSTMLGFARTVHAAIEADKQQDNTSEYRETEGCKKYRISREML